MKKNNKKESKKKKENNIESKPILFVRKLIKLLPIKISEKMENLLVQIFKFLIVGGTATILDWVLYFILYNYIKINPLIANIISFSISTLYNYYSSVKWVFDVNKDKSKNKMFVEFVLFSVIGLLLTELLLWIGIDILGLNAMIIKIIATAIVMVFNFVTRKMFLE